MGQFRYVAYTPDGVKETGVVDATTADLARAALRGRRLTVTEVTSGASGAKTAGSKKPRKVKPKDVAWLARNLATTQAAGLPVFRAVSMLAQQRSGTPIGDVLAAIEKEVAEGKPLGKAFRDHEAQLGTLTCALIEAGEATGKLDLSLQRLAEMLESRLRLQRQLKSAMSYPVVMGLLAGTLFVAMMLFVAPTFKDIYDQLNSDLPRLTTVLLGLSTVMKTYWYLLPVLGFGVVYGYKRGMKNPRFREGRDTLLLRLPVMGNLLHLTAVSRVAATLASTLGSGVPLLDGLGLSANVAGNVKYSAALERIRDQVRDGRTFNGSLAAEDIFPSLFAKIVEIGEETGSLPDLLERYAKTSQEEVEVTIEGFTALIEPLLIAVLGGIIAVMLIALYLPMFGVVNKIQ